MAYVHMHKIGKEAEMMEDGSQLYLDQSTTGCVKTGSKLERRGSAD